MSLVRYVFSRDGSLPCSLGLRMELDAHVYERGFYYSAFYRSGNNQQPGFTDTGFWFYGKTPHRVALSST